MITDIEVTKFKSFTEVKGKADYEKIQKDLTILCNKMPNEIL